MSRDIAKRCLAEEKLRPQMYMKEGKYEYISSG